MRLFEIVTAEARLEAAEIGEGPTTLFVHGGLGDRRTLERAALAYGVGRRVLYTQRGFGPERRGRTGAGFDPAAHARARARGRLVLRRGPPAPPPPCPPAAWRSPPTPTTSCP